MIDSPLWNLFYLGLTIAMMGYAYYSRHEWVQKLALATLVLWIMGQFAIHTEVMYTLYWLGDIVAMLWVVRLMVHNPHEPVLGYLSFVFMCFNTMHLINHYAAPDWLIYQIAGNVLYVAQCAILCIFGKKYGRLARCNPATKNRTDPFHHFMGHLWNPLKN